MIYFLTSRNKFADRQKARKINYSLITVSNHTVTDIDIFKNYKFMFCLPARMSLGRCGPFLPQSKKL